MTVILDNTGFSVAHWARFGEEEFIREALRDGIFRDKADRVELLKIAYQLIHDAARTQA